MGAIIIASQAVRKGGTIQLVGVYGMRYNAFFARGSFFTEYHPEDGSGSDAPLHPRVV